MNLWIVTHQKLNDYKLVRSRHRHEVKVHVSPKLKLLWAPHMGPQFMPLLWVEEKKEHVSCVYIKTRTLSSRDFKVLQFCFVFPLINLAIQFSLSIVQSSSSILFLPLPLYFCASFFLFDCFLLAYTIKKRTFFFHHVCIWKTSCDYGYGYGYISH